MQKYFVWICTAALLLTACRAEQSKTAEPEITQPAAAVSASQETPAKQEAPASSDEYIGLFSNGNYDTVTIEKDGDGYRMRVSLYRLTSLDEGTVSVSDEGLVFRTTDAALNPMTVVFCRDGENYALRIEESTWPLLEQGTVIRNLKKTDSLEVGYPDS